jgi:hypothetical protein
MPNTYTELRKTTVGTATASVTLDLTGIRGYTDLVMIGSATNPTHDSGLLVRFNSDSGSNYSDTSIYGNGSSAVSFRASNATGMNAGRTDTGISTNIINIQNYANTTTFKTVLTRGNDSALVIATVGLWRNTAAITSITVYDQNARNFSTGSTFSLYGIASEEAAAKATGGMVTSDANYWYHTFAASGTFTPKQSLTCDYLVVAGGGAGGAAESSAANYSGGGGAGGLRSTVTATGGGGSLESPLTLTSSTPYTVTVGAGGTASAASWTNGSNSVFSTITSTGGGAGGGLNSSPAWVAAASGGSGGGGDEANTAGGTGTANQGRAGGTSPGGPSGNAGGGGGGASVVGSNGSTNNGGAGGAGVATSITGSSVTYAGGGGGSGSSSGGAGGAGGGGAGSTGTATAGTENTGGGGGSGVRSGAAGGSGIVIVRYPK